jgi:hypothetical protein
MEADAERYAPLIKYVNISILIVVFHYSKFETLKSLLCHQYTKTLNSTKIKASIMRFGEIWPCLTYNAPFINNVDAFGPRNLLIGLLR